VIDNYRVVFAKGYGVAEFGGAKPVDSTTLFLAGSISKPIFASGFLRLLEDRKIPLDAEANSLLKSWHLPDTRFTEHEKVTLPAAHTPAGLTVWGFPGYALGGPVPTVPQLLDGSPPANTPAVRNDTFPGARWLYSGGGMTIAQLVATDVSGEDFPTLMRRLMLQPAGMTRSTYETPLPTNRRGEARAGTNASTRRFLADFMSIPRWPPPACGRPLPISRVGQSPCRTRIAVNRAACCRRRWRSRWSRSRCINNRPTATATGTRRLGFGRRRLISVLTRRPRRSSVADMFMRPGSGRGLVIMMNGVAGGLMTEIERAFCA
jgi:hypothetical protein